MKVERWEPAYRIEFPPMSAHLVGESNGRKVVSIMLTEAEACELRDALVGMLPNGDPERGSP